VTQGALLGRWALAALISLRPETLTRLSDVRFDQRVLLFTIGMSTLCGLLLSLGVRLAIGAQPRQILGLVMSGGIKLIALGLAPGMIGAMSAARLLEHQLFGVTPFDIESYVLAVATLGGAGLAACWLAARRIGAYESIQAIRTE
jgi:hypothetical protein